MDESNSIRNYCRICATNPPDVRNIFEVVYKEKLLSDILGQCLQCTIFRTEYLPEYICSQCCADLIKMHKFIVNYEKSEKWFISRYNAINEARTIKIETECPMELERIPEILVAPKIRVFAESLQNPSPYALELKQEFDCDYEFEGAELSASPNGSRFEMQELNETNCYESGGNNENTIRRVDIHKKKTIRREKETGQYQCSICAKQFLCLHNLRLHENLHTGRKMFKCYFCDLQVKRSDYRVNHIRKAHPEVVFECWLCRNKFNTFYDLCNHMLEGSHSSLPKNESNSVASVSGEIKRIRKKPASQKQYQCCICLRQFTDANNFKKHENLHTKAKIYKCEFCDSEFYRSDYRVRHIRKMHPEVTFECSCNLVFDTQNELGQHMLDQGHSNLSQNVSNPVLQVSRKMEIAQTPKEGTVETGQYQCSQPSCSKRFFTLHNLKVHENLHTGEKLFSCFFCDETFRRSDYRVKHVRKVHPEVVFECYVCKATFNQYFTLCQHMLEVHYQKIDRIAGNRSRTCQKYICEVCGMSFGKKYRLVDHRLSHSDGKKYQCPHRDCQQAYKRRSELKDHLHTHDEKLVYQCKYCELKLTSREGKKRHERRIHEAPKSYECYHCKMVFKLYFDLSRHMEIHLTNGRITFECNYCKRLFWSEHNYISHKRKHNAKIFDCEYCNESFEKRFALHSHVHDVHYANLKQHQCDQCPRHFPLKSTLKTHIYKIHTKEKQENHLCTECGKTFSAHRMLKLHLLVHSDERPISCTQCPSKFRYTNQLKAHMLVHTSEQNYICKVVVDGGQICGRKFRYSSSLNIHRKRHSNLHRKRFQCSSCPSKFFSNDKLRVHTRIHTGERPYKCDYCFRAFTQKGDMTKHMLIHLGPTPHKCTNCGEAFRLETELRKHSYTHFKPTEN